MGEAEIVEQSIAHQPQALGDPLAIQQDRVLPFVRHRLAGILARQDLMISLHAGLPFLDAGNNGKAFHKACAAKFAVDDDRQIMRDLFSHNVADRAVLSLDEILFLNLALPVVSERVLKPLRPQQAANLIDAQVC